MEFFRNQRKRAAERREQKRQEVAALDKQIEGKRRQIAALPANAKTREQLQMQLQGLGQKRNRIARKIGMPQLPDKHFIT